MSNDALSWAWRAPIPSGQKFVLVALADHGSDHSGEDWTCFPSVERLTARTGMGASTVRRHLDWLEAQGWLSRSRQRRGQRLGIYHYRLHRERLVTAMREKIAAEREGEPLAPDMSARETDPLAPGSGVSTAQIEQPLPPKSGALREPSEEPSKNPHTGRVREPGDDGFEAGFLAYETRGRKRTDLPRARAAWAKACETLTPEALTACVRRYTAGDLDLRRGDHGAPPFEKWLAGERWRHWGGAETPSARTACAVPAEVLEGVAAKAREPAGKWLAGAEWCEATRTIRAVSQTAADQLVAIIGRNNLEALDLRVEKRGKAGGA